MDKRGKNPCLKTIAKKDLWNFKNNLIPISFLDLMNNKKFLTIIEENDLMQFIHENKKGNDQNLELLTAYINYSHQEISPDIIYLFTRVYAVVKPGKSPQLLAALGRVRNTINETIISSKADSSNMPGIKKWKGRLKLKVL